MRNKILIIIILTILLSSCASLGSLNWAAGAESLNRTSNMILSMYLYPQLMVSVIENSGGSVLIRTPAGTVLKLRPMSPCLILPGTSANLIFVSPYEVYLDNGIGVYRFSIY